MRCQGNAAQRLVCLLLPPCLLFSCTQLQKSVIGVSVLTVRPLVDLQVKSATRNATKNTAVPVASAAGPAHNNLVDDALYDDDEPVPVRVVAV